MDGRVSEIQKEGGRIRVMEKNKGVDNGMDVHSKVMDIEYEIN